MKNTATANYSTKHQDNDNNANHTSSIIWMRSVLFQLYLTLITLVMGIGALPILLFGDDRKRKFCQTWSRTVLLGLRIICDINVSIMGKDNIPQSGAVIAANHQSMWETMQLFAILPKPVMVLKEELLRIPIFGLWLRASGCIALDRNAGSKAMRKLLTDAQKATANGGQIIIFPEGTRTKPGTKTSLKPGIAGIYSAANVPCLPVGHDSGKYWRFPGFMKRPGTIKMQIAPIIKPGLERKPFMMALDDAISNARPDLAAPINKL